MIKRLGWQPVSLKDSKMLDRASDPQTINTAWVFASSDPTANDTSFVRRAKDTLESQSVSVEIREYERFPKEGELRGERVDLMAFALSDASLIALGSVRSDTPFRIVHEVVAADKTPVAGDDALSFLAENLKDRRLDELARRRLALKAYEAAFERSRLWEDAIQRWSEEHSPPRNEHPMPSTLLLHGRLIQQLRYGENPDQKAGFYLVGKPCHGVATAEQHQGKDLSYNNLNDTDAALELVAEFDPASNPAVAIIKHANPCGVALGYNLKEAFVRALKCDPMSAYGGIVALNQCVDALTAHEISKMFFEVVIAPGATEEAKAILAGKKDLRLLTTVGLPDPRAKGLLVRSISGGLLVQSKDNQVLDEERLEVKTDVRPTPQQLADLKFAFTVCKHVKSNAIVYAKNGATVGIGAGQMSRFDAARIARSKAEAAAAAAGEKRQSRIKDSVVASDAFFPFADGLIEAIEPGAKAVIQPGGSIRDKDVIQAANKRGIAMVFTGVRHFRH